MRYPCARETLYLSHETAWWYWQNAKRAATTLAVSSRTCVLRDAAHTSQAAARIVGQGFFACEHLAVMVSEAGTHSTPHVSFHCTKSPLPQGSFVRLSQQIYIASPELSFLQACAEMPFYQAILYGCALCGTFALDSESKSGTAPRPTLTSRKKLERFVGQCAGLPGARVAANALRYVCDGSASPRESKSALLLGLPLCHGGYGLPSFELNPELAIPPKLQKMAGRKTFRIDCLWRDQRVALEYDSDAGHLASSERCDDSTKRAALREMGYSAFELTKLQVDSRPLMDATVDSLRRLLGVRKPQRLPKGYLKKQRELRRQLDLPL